VSLWRSFKVLYAYRPFLMNTLYIICYGIILLLVMTCLNYYCTYVMGSSSAATAIQAAYLVSSVAVSFLVSPIDRRLGRKKTMLRAARSSSWARSGSSSTPSPWAPST
jgi:Na+/melibiose symporter-like transporter